MATQLFTSMSGAKMAKLIGLADRRVAVATPAVRPDAAQAIIAARDRLGTDRVSVILDCDEEVIRLGYGEIDAVKQLRDAGCGVRQCSGLRIGVLVCDDRAWVFAPTALFVQPEVHSVETPNAVELQSADVERIVWRLLPAEKEAAVAEPSDLQPDEDPTEVQIEIGHTKVSESDLAQVDEGLRVAPPVPFDIARQVRVFHPYIQYVEIRLEGCCLDRRRIEIPKALQLKAGAKEELTKRLHTTFDLLQAENKLSSKELEEQLRKIREDFTKSLGRQWGRVLLRAQRPRFDDRLDEFRKQLETHKSKIMAELTNHLNESKRQLVEHYFKPIKDSPPDELLGRLISEWPTDDDVRSWINWRFHGVFPDPQSLVKGMDLHVQFRDVTYETLKEKGFADALNTAFPDVPWDKPFDEFRAAGERRRETTGATKPQDA